MIQDQSAINRFNGAKIVLQPTECQLKPLAEALAKFSSHHINLVDYEPDCRDETESLDRACLRYARAHHPNRGSGITFNAKSRKSKRKDGIEVLVTKPGKGQNQYDVAFSARVLNDQPFVQDPLSVVNMDILREQYKHARAGVPKSAVRQSIETILGNLKGLKIVTSLFWIPEESLEKWAIACAAFSSGGAGSYYTIPTDLSNPENIRLLRDSIIAAITRQNAEIAQEIQEGEIGPVALRNRLEKLDALAERGKFFEGVLNETLGQVGATLAVTKTAASTLLRAREQEEVYDGVFAS